MNKLFVYNVLRSGKLNKILSPITRSTQKRWYSTSITPNPTPTTKGQEGQRGKRALAITLGSAAILYYMIYNKDNVTFTEGNPSAPGLVNPPDTPTGPPLNAKPTKPRVVVLGTGWAALRFVEGIDTTLYDVVVVSPRNYFLYTPMLAGATVGTVEIRSLIEPIRKFCKRSGSSITFFEAECTDIDSAKNVIECTDKTGVQCNINKFQIPYDFLVVAVGSVPTAMGVKGVKENCLFLKEPNDVSLIRERIMDCFESSVYPGMSYEERKRLLHFVVVGGGPTGVEFSAELHDFVNEDLKKWFPDVYPDVKITLIQSGEHILNTYDAKISEYAEKQFARENIELFVNARVTEVGERSIKISDKIKKNEIEIPYGMCVWATGVAINPLVAGLVKKLDPQNNKTALTTDEFLQVKGTNNIFAIGDCATVTQRQLLVKFIELFSEADINGDGVLSLNEFKNLIHTRKKDYPQLEQYLSPNNIRKFFEEADLNHDGVLQMEEFKQALLSIDQKMKSLPSTAQCASQEGFYLGELFNSMSRGQELLPFKYRHFGSFAYVGGESAVADIPGMVQSGGLGVWWLWRATYFSKQLSWRNRIVIAFDWIKTIIFGRDISRV